MIRREDVWPIGAVGFILAVTAGWWGMALWSVPGAPDWLERARSVCFNITESGLPDAKGWLLLLGQPPIMVAALMVGWRNGVRDTLGHLLSSGRGRACVGGTLALVLFGVSMAGARVSAARLPAVAWGAQGPAPLLHARLDHPWPRLGGLVDQTGAAFSLDRLGGRSAFVTFAFGHCATLCPLVVHQVREVRAGLGPDASIVVFTLDPWRDTPGRLDPLLRKWGLDPAVDFVVGGGVEDVEDALDVWEVARTRDERTGDVVHVGLVYLVEPDGTVAFSSTGGIEHLRSLAARIHRGGTR